MFPLLAIFAHYSLKVETVAQVLVTVQNAVKKESGVNLILEICQALLKSGAESKELKTF